MTEHLRSLLCAAGLATLGVIASGSVAARATAQDVSIPLVTPSKAVANRAASAVNAHTAAEQSVDDHTTPVALSSSSSAPTRTAGSRASSMTPIVASRPQVAKPAAKPAASSAAAPGTPATAAKTGSAAAPGTPVLSVGSTPAAAGATKPAAGAGTTAAAAKPATAAMTKAGAKAPATPAAMAGATPSGVSSDSGSSISVTQRGTKGEVSLNREVFSYDPGARRDPFISLMRSGDLRPMLSDLRLVTVLYDPTGQNSIAVMRDQSTKDQYRVRVGQTLGRMRVAQIQPKQVVFTIEEVGFSRQEALALGDSTKARTQ